MSPQEKGISTTYKTRVALEKPCKKRQGILVGQLKDRRVLAVFTTRTGWQERSIVTPNVPVIRFQLLPKFESRAISVQPCLRSTIPYKTITPSADSNRAR